MHRRDLLAAAGTLGAMSLAGCLGGGPPAGGRGTWPGTPVDGPGDDPTDSPTGEPPSGEPGTDDERLAELVAGNAAFALDLHRHLADGSADNLFLSPYSVSVALAMAYAGARGETERQLGETLNYALGGEVHPAFADLRDALDARATTEDPAGDDEAVDAFRLAVANALWGQAGYPFDDDYLALLDEHYGAGLRRADFAADPDGERERINAWVADATEGRIEDLLPTGSLTPATVLVLTNAIYFKAGWRSTFDPEATEDGPFAALDGTESTVPFMRQHVRTNHASVPGAEAVELPYVGGEVSMVLLLPDEGRFAAFERSLDADRLFGIFEALSDAEGELALPRFEISSQVRLAEALADLGAPAAFGSGADFGGLVEGDGAGPWLDEVFHEAFVSVDEEGTEAAGATAVSMVVSKPPSWGELRFDRPFLCCVRDRPTDAVLFLGRVADAGTG